MPLWPKSVKNVFLPGRFLPPLAKICQLCMKEQIDTEFWIHITQSNKQSNIISQSEKYNSLKDIFNEQYDHLLKKLIFKKYNKK